MNLRTPLLHARLPRLAAENYQGYAYVHWTMGMQDRASGWLTPGHHAALRELLFHTCLRYHLACPSYCLMPDHAHFLWIGLHPTSDQRLASSWFRRYWNAMLAPVRQLHCQAYDHVLRAPERSTQAFASIAAYIQNNPVRAGLVTAWGDWPYLGAIYPGVYPFDPRNDDFWDRFWREQIRSERSA